MSLRKQGEESNMSEVLKEEIRNMGRVIKINEEIKELESKGVDVSVIRDGYHSFSQLYDHRIILYLSLIQSATTSFESTLDAYYSDKHHDGGKWDGWILVVMHDPNTGEQISYHIAEHFREFLEEMEIEYIEQSPLPFDGHTSEDVLERLSMWFIGKSFHE